MSIITVLDQGGVELLDQLGDDITIVDAARVSVKNAKKRSTPEQLIDYLMRHQHTSPFEQVVFTFRLAMPFFVGRQWLRHRTARLNEISGRYSMLDTRFYTPEVDVIGGRGKHNKQGSDGVHPEAEAVHTLIAEHNTRSGALYKSLVDMDVALETARLVLPLTTYTEMVWQIDLHNLFHLLELRLDEHAQFETRQYAQAIAELVAPRVPIAWRAFENHRLKAARFSDDELEILLEALDDERVVDLIEKSGLRESRRRELLMKVGLYRE